MVIHHGTEQQIIAPAFERIIFEASRKMCRVKESPIGINPGNKTIYRAYSGY
jgi:hypothetical protein